MAELEDAQASGACGSNIVRVQVPSSALFFYLRETFNNKVSRFLFSYISSILFNFNVSAYLSVSEYTDTFIFYDINDIKYR